MGLLDMDARKIQDFPSDIKAKLIPLLKEARYNKTKDVPTLLRAVSFDDSAQE